MLERIKELELKNEGERNETTRLISIIKTQLELEKLWLSAIDNKNDLRRKALANTAKETAELYLLKAEKL